MIVEVDGSSCDALLKMEQVCVLDVRSPVEFNESRIPGAINIDILDNNAFDKLARLRKDQTYLVYCAIGVRSRSTTKIMKTMGFITLFHLSNGLSNYTGPIDKKKLNN